MNKKRQGICITKVVQQLPVYGTVGMMYKGQHGDWRDLGSNLHQVDWTHFLSRDRRPDYMKALTNCFHNLSHYTTLGLMCA